MSDLLKEDSVFAQGILSFAQGNSQSSQRSLGAGLCGSPLAYTVYLCGVNENYIKHTYINFISIRIVNSTIVLVSPDTINNLRNQI